jgi:hypothetical protein
MTMKNLTLLFTIFLCFASCNKEETRPEQLSWVGNWIATTVLRDGTLTEIPTTIDGISPRYITIIIEEGDNGYLRGESFRNGFGMEFWLSPNNMVEFGPADGTRVQEEEWGSAVRRNIAKTKSYEAHKENMYFKDIDNNILLLFTKPQ